jgi:hypothetical protein
MSTRWLWVGLPILAIGCVAPAGPGGTESDGQPLPQNDEATSPYARHAVGPPNLCVVGQRIATVFGQSVTVPVACTADDVLDPEDPVEDSELDPGEAFEVPAPEAEAVSANASVDQMR